MATYLIGDIQGCFTELELLLKKVDFSPKKDQLWLMGDLVSKGKESKQVMDWVLENQQAVFTVLGNHDLHLLAITQGVRKAKPKDYLNKLLASKQLPDYIDWLRKQPLMRINSRHGFVTCHAGIWPHWKLAQAKQFAEEVERVLAADDYDKLLKVMYGNEPDYWKPSLKGYDRHRFIINAFTRMRYCYPDSRLELNSKMPPHNAPGELLPWFKLREHLQQDQERVFFGHWAALMGCTGSSAYTGLDTSCYFGNWLTMLRWEDQQIFSQKQVRENESNL